ncbi:mucin-4-like isoform X2 [Stegostoma tigrinum]|uniref:mucin-4-like isoform X2 n=1 Tax=Stegostoma tigrinum TaxID=3053191 RepID=UPI0028706014|nr:mucin-4-like isoform X2 [Stegostoma tigrinum]
MLWICCTLLIAFAQGQELTDYPTKDYFDIDIKNDTVMESSRAEISLSTFPPSTDYNSEDYLDIDIKNSTGRESPGSEIPPSTFPTSTDYVTDDYPNFDMDDSAGTTSSNAENNQSTIFPPPTDYVTDDYPNFDMDDSAGTTSSNAENNQSTIFPPPTDYVTDDYPNFDMDDSAGTTSSNAENNQSTIFPPPTDYVTDDYPNFDMDDSAGTTSSNAENNQSTIFPPPTDYVTDDYPNFDMDDSAGTTSSNAENNQSTIFPPPTDYVTDDYPNFDMDDSAGTTSSNAENNQSTIFPPPTDYVTDDYPNFDMDDNAGTTSSNAENNQSTIFPPPTDYVTDDYPNFDMDDSAGTASSNAENNQSTIFPPPTDYVTGDHQNFDIDDSTRTTSSNLENNQSTVLPLPTVVQNTTHSKTTFFTTKPWKFNTTSSTMIQTSDILNTSQTTKVTTTRCPIVTLQDLGVISAESIKNTSFTLKWSDNTSEICGGYNIEKSSEIGGLLCILNFHNNTCSLFGLSPGQTYTVNVHLISKTSAILTRTLNVTTDADECSNGENRCEQICIERCKFEDSRGYECSCERGFILSSDNETCTALDSCTLNCTNGKCFIDPDSEQPTCYCDVGYFLDETGRICNDIDECLSLPCWNEATCEDSINAFSCNCLPGYTGQLCEQVINNCASKPCQNNGFCQNRINDYRCWCLDNWEGKNCNTDVDECSHGLHRCDQSAGICNNVFGSYTCSCKEGYEGDGFICKEKRLFNYGLDFGDVKLVGESQDFNSPVINIPQGFPFDDAFYYKLYFSDNGLITFQRNNDYLQYMYSTPFWAFSKYSYLQTPPMIAVFWDDADLTRGLGSIYYQVYDFKNETDVYSQTFQSQLQEHVNEYYGSELNMTSFSPKWALKVTWENVLPYNGYQNTDPDGTNTYQAVLTTDGIFSFCLIQFKDGGMNWKYDIRPYYRNYALMGYYSGSLRSYLNSDMNLVFNDPHTRFNVPPEKIYHPDMYPGFKTGKNGHWAYRLERNNISTINPRQKCMDWYLREPEAYWSNDTSPCPCTFWQAIFDRAFIWGNIIYYYGFSVKDLQASYLTMQSRFPNQQGSGMRCYYSWNGALIHGEKETFLPTPWIYFDWWTWWQKGYTYYMEKWNDFWYNVLPPLRKQYREMEVDPYHDCCRDSGDDYFCNLYQTKRPEDHCIGYIPPRIGFFFGDPHVVTLDSVKYTFNGMGEFILLNVMDDNDALTFTLHGRTLRAGVNRTSQATSFVALAAQGPSGTKVQWNLNDDDEISVMIDGSIFEVTENSTFVKQVTLQKTSDNETVATFEGGTSITVSGLKGALAFTTSLDNSLKNKTEGLLGVWNDDKTDDFKAADGKYLDFDGTNLPNDTQIFFQFGMTWKTSLNNCIFTYNTTAGESWYTYNNNSFVPLFYDELLRTTEKEKIDKANETCQGNDDCIFDVLSTDDLSFGAATLQSVTAFTAQNSTMNNFPPNISGSSTIQTRLNEPVFVLFTATDSNDDEVTLSVETDSPDITITENGNFSWNPTSSIPVFAIIQASDSKAVSVLGLTLVLCNCSINSTCDYSRSILSTAINNTVFKVAGCHCNPAYTGDYCTEDFDACQDNQCFLNDTCKDQPAPLEGYTCDPCPDNLKGDGIKCFDLDECLENVSSCEQICTNVFGGYNCSCNEGYAVSTLNSSLCTDIDECSSTSACPKNADCQNTIGNYTCVCKSGYEGDPHKFCIDINECLDYNACSSRNSICTNTEGSYICNCSLGYEGSNCSVINGCVSCSPNSQCTFDGQSYYCTCKPGFSGNGTTCIPLTRPCDSSQCSPSFCKNGGTCVPNPDDGCKPFCECPRQYRGEQCTLASLQFVAEPLPTMPKRSVNITLRLQGINVTVLSNRSSANYISLTNSTAVKVFEILSRLQRFADNSKPIFWSDGETVTAAVVALFNYNGNKVVIDFLNDGLYAAVQNTFNNLQRFARALTPDAISFEHLNRIDITDISKLSYDDVLNHSSCNNTEFAGYVLEWNDESGVICRSPCDLNYCLNEAECQHLTTGPMCKCVSRAIYSSHGDRCEHLSLTLGAFFGILFGALGLLLIISLPVVMWKHKSSNKERLINENDSKQQKIRHPVLYSVIP